MLTGNVRREAVGVIRLVRGVALPEESYAVEQPNEADVSDECEKNVRMRTLRPPCSGEYIKCIDRYEDEYELVSYRIC